MKQYKIIHGLLALCTSLISAGDGALDLSFNGTGIVILPAPTGGNISGGLSLRTYVDYDKNIYFQGTNFLCRLTSEGVVDTTFNVLSATPGFFVSTLVDVAFDDMLVQSDGKIILVGADSVGPVIIRLNADGTSDQTFNDGQPIHTSLVNTIWIGIALQEDSKIVVSGFTTTPSSPLTLARFNVDGTLDATFGGTGIVQTTVLEGGIAQSVFEGGVAITADQNIVVAAYGASPQGGQATLIVASYKADGTLDATFNATGSQPGIVLVGTAIFAGQPLSLPGVVIQPDGRILVGYNSVSPVPSLGVQVVRLNQDGSLDSTFNGTGFATFFNPGLLTQFAQLLLQSDGKIVVVTLADTQSASVVGFVARYVSSGELDITFGSPNGFIEIAPPAGGLIQPAGGALQQDGKILVGGAFQLGSALDFLVTRLLDATPLTTTTVNAGLGSLSGSAQSLGVLTLYVDGTQVCASEIVNNSWQCTGVVLDPGTHSLLAVAQYPGGNVNIASSCLLTVPVTALSLAIKNKYCTC